MKKKSFRRRIWRFLEDDDDGEDSDNNYNIKNDFSEYKDNKNFNILDEMFLIVRNISIQLWQALLWILIAEYLHMKGPLLVFFSKPILD